jgi:hypothetical protein
MQLFAKTKASKGGAPDFSPWHPNFRNTAELPDTKTVRTRFFVNAACVAFALCGVIFYAYNEYQFREVSAQLQQLEDRIASDTKPSREALALYTKFKEEEAKAQEVTAFLSAEKLVFSDFIFAVGESLPENVMITGFQYGRTEVTVRGFVRGAAQQASGVASAFEKQLRDNPAIASKFESIALSNLAREVTAGSLSFELVMKFKK